MTHLLDIVGMPSGALRRLFAGEPLARVLGQPDLTWPGIISCGEPLEISFRTMPRPLVRSGTEFFLRELLR
jgi:hypothetical protein